MSCRRKLRLIITLKMIPITYLSVYDNRDDASESTPSTSQPSSLTHVHSIQSHTLPTPTFLTFMCTQILWCLPRLDTSRSSYFTMRPDGRLSIFSTHITQCIRGVGIPPFYLLVSHYTDTHLYVYSLTLTLSLTKYSVLFFIILLHFYRFRSSVCVI